jgi:O-methyltransferase
MDPSNQRVAAGYGNRAVTRVTQLTSRALEHAGLLIRRRPRVNAIIRRLGYVQQRTTDIDPAFWSAFEMSRPNTMTSLERMYAIWISASYVVENEIEGDFVECGVWRGGSAMMMALALKHFGDATRQVHLFDTFAGMTEPSDRDSLEVHRRWRVAQRDNHNDWCYSPEERVRSNMALTGFDPRRVVFVKGPVEETLPRHAPESVSLLRLDTDWFDSTFHELVHLYDRVSIGGVLILDDYGHHAGARAAVDTFLSERGVPLLLSRIDYTGRLAVKVK